MFGLDCGCHFGFEFNCKADGNISDLRRPARRSAQRSPEEGVELGSRFSSGVLGPVTLGVEPIGLDLLTVAIYFEQSNPIGRFRGRILQVISTTP